MNRCTVLVCQDLPLTIDGKGCCLMREAGRVLSCTIMPGLVQCILLNRQQRSVHPGATMEGIRILDPATSGRRDLLVFFTGSMQVEGMQRIIKNL